MKINKLVFLILPILLLSSCDTKKLKIDVFLYNGEDTFISSLSKDIHNQLKSNYDIDVYDAYDSQISQNTQILNSIKKETNLLLVNTVDRLASSAIIEKAAYKNIPVIFFNREPLFEDMKFKNNVFYVGTSAEIAGIYQAEMVANLFGNPYFLNKHYDKNYDGKIQICLLKGEKGHQDSELRTLYVLKTLRNKGYNLDLLEIETANWNRQEGFGSMKTIYENHGDAIELLISNNDDMALGAIDYLLEKKIFKKGIDNSEQPFPVFGVDATDVGKNAIREGLLSGTVLNDSGAQANAISTLVDYVINKKSFDDFPFKFVNGNFIFLDEQKITIDNI